MDALNRHRKSFISSIFHLLILKLSRSVRSEGGAGCKKPRSKSGARSGGSSSPDAPVRPESLDISMDDGDSLPISRPY